jgi:hypothetical protein
MRRILLLVVGLLSLPVLAAAQVENCPDCLLGIFDDINLTLNHGSITQGVVKELFIGVILAAPETGVTGIELSVTGMTPADNILITGVEGLTDPLPNVILGSLPAPADTVSGTGGLNVAWSSCISGSRALVKVSVVSFTGVSANHALKIIRRFPPTSPSAPFPLLIRCDIPVFTKVRPTAGCFVLNWDGVTNPADGCGIRIPAVGESSWTGMKQLYR